MEFRYNLGEVFKTPISKINYTLLPLDFSGDRRNALHCTSVVADVIDQMGIASAKAQELQHPITSSEKLRNFDHLVYLMVDHNDNHGRGSVVGLLKVGVKNLFLFDETGMVHEKKSLCILDFYVHESKQRTGYGKILYEYMLKDKNIEPCRLAIDKPSQKFLSFLYRHYGLSKIYPQNNNFVLFEGFFDDGGDASHSQSMSSDYSEETHKNTNGTANGLNTGYDNHSVKSAEYSPKLYGRHTAFKPHDSMGKIIGQGSKSSNPSPTSSGV